MNQLTLCNIYFFSYASSSPKVVYQRVNYFRERNERYSHFLWIEFSYIIFFFLSGSRALKFHREDNLVYPWPHAEFQINSMAPAALWGTDIRLIPIFIPFPENGSHFGCSWNFGRNQSHSKAKIKYSKNVLLTFSNFGSEVPEKGVPSQTKFRFFNKIANNSKVAAPRNL